MALKKSELYSSLWSSCDELRGGMDASQYKDYVLVLLFIKYVSDKYESQPYAPINVPQGASFRDMVALKGTSDIGDQINKKIIAPLANANKLSDLPDFNDANKLGSGKEMVDRLTNLIAIFENRALDFSKNRADGDDILGDAYEYLMRHFATESGKSKGQFYTPAEVSRVMAQILGIRNARTNAATTVFDPTCGSGSLLLKVTEEAKTKLTIYGQEKDAATSGLARMNMILHNNAEALIEQGNTLADPKFKDGQGGNESLKTFDYVVANPPFSDKRWSTGLTPVNDPWERFKPFAVPPSKQGDYAYLLHIVRTLKSTGKGACILPHGVLFRGHAEADIRRALVRKGYLKGIIGLPPNLFYGTGIPACIVVVDKQDAHARKGIFMIDASRGFMKDGPKNRLRSQDIHKIVDVFNKRMEVPRYARVASVEEIEKNDFNLNLPRYIDSQQAEDQQDIEGHLKGGIPMRDVDALHPYWSVCSGLRSTLFSPRAREGLGERAGYLDLAVNKTDIKSTIYGHPEFAAFIADMKLHFAVWRDKSATALKVLGAGCNPKQVIFDLSEDLLASYTGKPLIAHYDVYQHLMDYWAETMQDDCYSIAADGWKAETTRIVEKDKKGKEKDRGWTCDLIPKRLIVARYYAEEQRAIDQLSVELENVAAKLAELEEEHGGEEGVLRTVGNKAEAQEAWDEAMEVAWKELNSREHHEFQETVARSRIETLRLAELKGDGHLQALKNKNGNITKTAIRKRLKTTQDSAEKEILNAYLASDGDLDDSKARGQQLREAAKAAIMLLLEQEPGNEVLAELRVLTEWLKLHTGEADLKKRIKEAETSLDAKAYAHYPKLTEAEIKSLVVDDKWLAALDAAIHGEMDRVSQQLTQRVRILAERYETPLPQMVGRVAELEDKVNRHLKRMGFSW